MTESHCKKCGQHQRIDYTMQGQTLVIIYFYKIGLMYHAGPVNGLHQAVINANDKQRNRDAQLPEDNFA